MKKAGTIFRENTVTHIKDGIENRNNTFMVSYTKISGPTMNTLRKGLKAVGADFYVSRNSVAELALKDMKFGRLAEKINGQTAFIWSDSDSVTVSKTLIKFQKEFQGLVIQGGLLDGAILEKTDVERLSNLPSKKVLVAQFLGVLQSPVTRLAVVLNAKTRDLLSILKQVSEQKGGK